MPETDGRLTQEDRDKIRKWFTEKKALQACPACGTNEWTIGGKLSLAPAYDQSGFLAGAGYPSVIILCDNCAFTRWHNAILMGIVPRDTPSEDKKTEVKHGA